MKRHPLPEVLALYSSSDLRLLDRWKVRHHLSHCEYCEQQVSLFRAARSELKRQAKTETLTGFEAIADWTSLEREMEGNIVVGLAAAHAIEKQQRSHEVLVKFALAFGILLLFILGWITHIPAEQSVRLYSALHGAFSANRSHEPQGSVLRSVPDGIVVGSQEGSLTILSPATAMISVSGKSSVEARYVDDETGQVTIAEVYGQ